MKSRSRWYSISPNRAVFLVGLIAAVLSCYPVVFLGRSFVTPNNGGISMLYGTKPFVYGSDDRRIETVRRSDVGATVWQCLPYSFILNTAIFRFGEFPHWNRFNSSGVTLFGQGQSMLGDPLHLIPVLANGAAWSWDLKFVLAKILFCTGVGLTVLAATRFLPAAMIVSASSAFIGFFLFRVNHPAFFSFCYAPWVLYCWFRLVSAPHGRALSKWLLALVLACWIVINSGAVKESYVLVLSFSLTGFITFLLHRNLRMDKRRVGGVLVLHLCIMIMLAMPVWLTFLQDLRSSFSLSDARRVITEPAGFFIGLFDEIFFAQVTTNRWVILPSANFLILVATAWGLVRVRRWWNNPFFASSVIGAFIAFSLTFGLVPSWIVERVPLLGQLQEVHIRYSNVLLVHVFVLAGFGIRTFWEQCGSPVWIRTYWTVAAVVLALVGLFYAYALLSKTPVVLLAFMAVVSIGVVASALVLPVAGQRVLAKKGGTWALLVLILCLVVIHFRFGMHVESGFRWLDRFVFNPRTRVELAVPSPAINALVSLQREPSRVVGVGETLHPGYHDALGIEGINGPDAIRNRHVRELMDAFGFKRDWLWRILFSAEDLGRYSRLLDLLNVRYILAPRDTDDLPGDLKPVGTHDLRILERSSAWPRAFFSDRITVYKQPGDIVDLANRSTDRPFAAVHEDEVPEGIPTGKAGIVIPATDYRLTTNRTSFSVTAPGPGLVTLTEAYVPHNFRVTVNGRPAEYTRVNHAFKGVFLKEPGTYVIEFQYRPLWWGLSLWMMLGGLVGMALVHAYLWIRPEAVMRHGDENDRGGSR